MKTSLEAHEGHGSLVAFFPAPSPLLPLFLAKPERRGGRAVSPMDYREPGAVQPPTPGAGATLRPAPAGSTWRTHPAPSVWQMWRVTRSQR